jgi:hypothetical protein
VSLPSPELILQFLQIRWPKSLNAVRLEIYAESKAMLQDPVTMEVVQVFKTLTTLLTRAGTFSWHLEQKAMINTSSMKYGTKSYSKT